MGINEQVVKSTTPQRKGLEQVRYVIAWGLTAGSLLVLASLGLFAGAILQMIFVAVTWSGRLQILLEGVLWASAIGGLGTLCSILAQLLRCAYDWTYRAVEPLDDP